MEQQPLISFRAAGKRYPNGTHALQGITLDIAPGEFVSVIGPSGSGKSTLLRLINRLITATEGEVLVDGKDMARLRGAALREQRRKVGMIFQNYNLVYRLSVLQNALHGRLAHLGGIRGLLGLYPEADKRRAFDLLVSLGLGSFGYVRAGELSGGQKQRVSLARAIVSGPSLLLMDEPLSALDADLRISMRKEISRIHRLTGTTVIFVTHDQGEALSLSDRIMVLNGGRIEQLGTPQDIYLRPATKFIASFIGRCNFVKGDWNGDTFRAGEGSFVFQGAPVADVFHRDHVCPIRPEQFRLAEDGSGLPGVIREKQYNGREIHYAVSCQDDLFSVYTSAAENYAIGDEVYLQCR